MEASNPGGYALALEIGYARALGKHVIFVDQISDPDTKRYFDLVRQCADAVFASIPEAATYLREWIVMQA